MSPTTTSAAVTVDVHLEDGDRTDSLHRDARAGLARRAKDLSPIWLYDERGCQLYEAITRLPEYYPARTERAILAAHADAAARLSAADTLVELTDAGFSPVAWWADPAGDYGLSLSLR